MGRYSVNFIRSKLATNKHYLIIVFLWIFYSEYFSYWTLSSTWFEPPACASPDCKTILLVSDPQIVGREWYGYGPFIDFIAIWDSDRYLKRTFLSAYNYIKPDIILFLGDLMDQGHKATQKEFYKYVDRFWDIFELAKSPENMNVIIAPGDNDIGGEEDVLLLENIERFEKMFNQTEESTLIDNIEFCKVNVMKSSFQKSRDINADLIRVVLTHVPLLQRETAFVKEVVKHIRPNVIFSGHLHTSYHYAAYETDILSYKHMKIYPYNTQPKTYKFHEGLIHEIIVPTCSYRMGQYNMGYGVAFLDTKNKNVKFSVLWLPHRFRQLSIHVVVLFPLVLAVLLRMYRKVKRFYLKRRLSSPEKLYSTFP